MKSGHLVGSKYRLNNRLGKGGMGAVWSAVHLHTGRELAIKFLHPLVASENDDVRQRFMQEARTSSRVNHPGIVDIFDAGETDDGTLYLVMDLLEGLALSDALRAEPPLNARELLIVLGCVAQALAAAHAAGIIHRDVKPPNIFLARDRGTQLIRTKVLDFGVSKVLSGEDGIATHTGSLLGSPRYMAPEQAVSAARADQRSDLWSIGVMLFEALTGEFPHDGDSSNSLVIAIATKPPKSIHRVAPHLPLPVRMLIGDLLQPHADRIETANELVERIRTVLADRDLSSIPCSVPFKSKKLIVRPERFVIDPSALLPPSEAELEPHPTEEMSLDPIALGVPPPPPSVPVPDEKTLVKAPSLGPPAPPAALVPAPSQLSQVKKTLPLDAAALVPRPAPQTTGMATDPLESVSSINVARGVTTGGVPTPSLSPSDPPPAFLRPKRGVAIVIGGLAVLGAAALAVIVVVKSGSTPSDDGAAQRPARSSLPAPSAQVSLVASAGPLVAPEPSASTALRASASARPSASAAPKAPTRPTQKPTQPVDPLSAKGSGIFGGKR
ncbi:MAG: serine/threonine protein kinase [Polyangiaceae bacterium]|nr:serine/threonine protein kinase [Polyangiaceae bacterium]